MTHSPHDAAGASPSELRRRLFGLRLLLRFVPRERQAALLWAAAFGFAGALVGLLFKQATLQVQRLLTGQDGALVEVFRQLPSWQQVAVPAAGALVAGVILSIGMRWTRNRPADYMEAVTLGDGDVPVKPSLIRSAAALFSIASGAAIGREGPLVQLAALVSSIPTRWGGHSPARRRLFVACGAAAGIAAAYNAPIAGALFVAEIVLGSIAMESFGPLIIASVVSAITVRTFESAAPLYASPGVEFGPPLHLLLYVLLGIGCGFAAHLFQIVLRLGRRAFALLPDRPWLRLTLGGLAVGGLALWRPEVTGNGESTLRELLDGGYAWQIAALIVGAKVIAVAAAFGSGAVGGVFTPSLFTGAVVGFLFGSAVHAIWPATALDPAAFALVGMGAFLAAVTQAPVMAILMLFEMTLHYEIMLPLMTASVLAHFTARGTGAPALYDAALRAGPRSVFDRPLGQIRTADVMRRNVPALPPDASFGEVAKLFLSSRGREIFVVRADQHLVGVILIEDVRPFLRDPHLADVVQARDICHDDVPSLRGDAALTDALSMFSRGASEILPILAPEDDHVLGVLSRSDVFLAISEVTRRASVETGRAA